ncbi:hypothetical protein EJ110_NYTH06400 [Nymphaea thermarum]|nr:hypothetical protein EJ110_NYTH06400 [Nymphaea thermarum]
MAMEKEVENSRGCRPPEPDHFLQWGNTKRLRCVKVQVKDEADERTMIRAERRSAAADKGSSLLSSSAGFQHPPSHRVLRNSEPFLFGLRSLNNDHFSSTEKADGQNHHQAKVGSGRNGVLASSETMVTEKKQPNHKANGLVNNGSHENGHQSNHKSQPLVWPKFIIALNCKEKEEDFMLMKGSKLPQRPKKRSKFLQRTLNLVSPGSWLCELNHERYEVREKKTSKKRPRGLKAMVGSMDSDSD